MKKRLKTHSDHNGPQFTVDLEEVTLIEESGNRESVAGWVVATLTMRSGLRIQAKMAPVDVDELMNDWNPPV
jgi:hypothetical protein